MGRKPIAESKVIIVGLARNCEKNVEHEIKRIDVAFKAFQKVCWIIVESDSVDATFEKINSLTGKIEIDLISLGHLRDVFPKRTERIAKCRNEYLKSLQQKKYSEFDFVVVADLDGVNKNVSANSVSSCWSTEVEWDACFSNQSAPYYDIWALRHEKWSPNDCWKNYEFLLKHKVGQSKALYASVHARMIRIPPKEAPIEVNSAFGGLAIYKKRLLEGSEYIGLNPNGEEVCEHVSIHEVMKQQGARMFIIPAFINGGWNEHNAPLLLHNKIKFRFKLLIKKFLTCFISEERLKSILQRS